MPVIWLSVPVMSLWRWRVPVVSAEPEPPGRGDGRWDGGGTRWGGRGLCGQRGQVMAERREESAETGRGTQPSVSVAVTQGREHGDQIGLRGPESSPRGREAGSQPGLRLCLWVQSQEPWLPGAAEPCLRPCLQLNPHVCSMLRDL